MGSILDAVNAAMADAKGGYKLGKGVDRVVPHFVRYVDHSEGDAVKSVRTVGPFADRETAERWVSAMVNTLYRYGYGDIEVFDRFTDTPDSFLSAHEIQFNEDGSLL